MGEIKLNQQKPQQKIRSNQMKKLSILICTMIALGFMAITVLAQNAHFMSCSSSVNPNGSLSVSFRIAGLGWGSIGHDNRYHHRDLHLGLPERWSAMPECGE
jgi:hypothetical protein